jgi:hypothetical protein
MVIGLFRDLGCNCPHNWGFVDMVIHRSFKRNILKTGIDSVKMVCRIAR